MSAIVWREHERQLHTIIETVCGFDLPRQLWPDLDRIAQWLIVVRAASIDITVEVTNDLARIGQPHKVSGADLHLALGIAIGLRLGQLPSPVRDDDLEAA